MSLASTSLLSAVDASVAKAPLKTVNVTTSVEPSAVTLVAPLTELVFPKEHPVIKSLVIFVADVKLSSVPLANG